MIIRDRESVLKEFNELLHIIAMMPPWKGTLLLECNQPKEFGSDVQWNYFFYTETFVSYAVMVSVVIDWKIFFEMKAD